MSSSSPSASSSASSSSSFRAFRRREKDDGGGDKDADEPGVRRIFKRGPPFLRRLSVAECGLGNTGRSEKLVA